MFRVDGQRYNDLVQLIRQRDQQAGQSYSMQSQAYRTMNRAEGITLRQIMGGTGGSGGGKNVATTKQEIEAVTGSIDAQAKKAQNWGTCLEIVKVKRRSPAKIKPATPLRCNGFE